jgi:putative membrane protein
MSEGKGRAPVVIELDGPPADVAAAAPPDDAPLLPQGRAVRGALGAMGGRPRPVLRVLLVSAAGFAVLVLGVAAWDFVLSLLARAPALGWVAAGLLALAVLALVVAAVGEWAGYRRLGRLDGLRRRVEAAGSDLAQARAVSGELARLYRAAAPGADLLDADAVLAQAELQLLAPLDSRAVAEVEGAARQVALVTALVPVALADVAAALFANLRMIRRISEIYGGRGGVLGGWRLARMVAAHLLATGLVAMGDDLVGSLAGGGVVSKLSRRFGEGVVNGALTARIGLAAIEVCRPMPFAATRRPRAGAVLARALRGALPGL